MKKLFSTIKKNIKDLKHHVPETIGLIAMASVVPAIMVITMIRIVSAAGVA